MPLHLTPFDDKPLCFGHTWVVHDQAHLARVVARLLLGEALHAASILGSGGALSSPVSQRGINWLLEHLSVQGKSDVARWHRDGWLFQLISWTAAQLVAPSGSLLRSPQSRPADKGFDGLILELHASGDALTSLVVCEDKATDDPRGTVRRDVWPEITSIEAGYRDSELVSELSAVLSRLGDPALVRTIIDNVVWEEQRRYRVAITVGASHDGADGRARLFEGYDECAVGPCLRRRAETMSLPQLRAWMDAFSTGVAQQLKELQQAQNV
jgi:hypothetical protein